MRAPILALTVLLAGTPGALAQNKSADGTAAVPVLTLDHPERVNGIGVACTGVGSDSRANPRWSAYSLKLEFAGENGGYLGYVDVALSQDGHQLVHVRCPGPWLLFQLPPGQFAVQAWVGQNPADFKARVPAQGQADIVVHFPD